MKHIFLFISLLAASPVISQNVAINTTGSAAVNSAALDVDVADKGILIPRVALTTTTTFAPVSGTATVSLMVYNTATAGVAPTNVSPGYYYWNGISWERIVPRSEVSIPGDIKYGIQTSDHNGWVKLDGRSLSVLTGTQQANAAALGIVTSLPDATNRVIKQKPLVNTTGGMNTVNLVQANLPNYTMTATTSTDGSHTHTGNTNTAGNHSHGHNAPGGAGNRGLIRSSCCWESNTSSGIAGSLDITSGEPDLQSAPAGLTINNAGNHSHTVTTAANGNHTHTVTINSGGSGTGLTIENAYLSMNAFIYLGY